jgi:DNA ligase 1
VEVLKNYFLTVPYADKVHTLALFTGRKPKRPINATLFKLWAIELSKIPAWLFEESYQVVGDLGETVALLLPEATQSSEKTLAEWIGEINGVSALPEEERRSWLVNAWNTLNRQEKFVFNKILTGSFRVGVSQSLIIKALSDISGLEPATLTHRIMGNWSPGSLRFSELLQEQDSSDDCSRPYPFCLAYAIQETSDKQRSAGEMEEILGSPELWQAEWKWDGIRAQAIHRDGKIFIWTRGEELSTDKFPELHDFLRELPDGTVLDGEAICFSE